MGSCLENGVVGVWLKDRLCVCCTQTCMEDSVVAVKKVWFNVVVLYGQ